MENYEFNFWWDLVSTKGAFMIKWLYIKNINI